MTVAEYINQLQTFEEYSFSLEELLQNTTKSETSVKRELSRLIDKKVVVNLRKGFYLIIPPRYSVSGKLPIQLYSNKLFEFLRREYYVAFYSAAKIHGASHQQSQREYIMTETPKLINIKKNSIDIRFLTSTIWPNKNILLKKSDAGIYKVSSPALTTVDLINHQTKLGGLNRLLTSIEELLEVVDSNDLGELLIWYPHKSTLQRLGFLIDILSDYKALSDQLFSHLKSSKFYPILLSPNTIQKPGAVKNQWKVDVNIKLESDL